MIPTLVVAFISITAWPGQALTAEFSADLIRTSGGDMETSKVYVKGKMRREELMEDGEVSVINIARIDKGVNWNLMPQDKMYMEMPLEGMKVGAMEDIEELESRAKMKMLGSETVGGYACEKRQYDDRAQGSVIVWYSAKLDYPVKIHVKAFGGEEEMILEYKNIKTGKIDDSKFEIPGDYEKFAIPGMPAGMPQGMPAGMPGAMPGGMPDIPGMGK
jgi:hypothetical protein